MKYMGSKQTMLLNGLGEAIEAEVNGKRRLVDLFCGSGAVAAFAAERFNTPVLAIDLQEYAVVLAAAIVERTDALNPADLTSEWLSPVRRARPHMRRWKSCSEVLKRDKTRLHRSSVVSARELCRTESGGLVWSSYGGYYFSPGQALTFDLMLERLPQGQPARDVCLAALIAAASRCAASPGHTAQPFRPTRAALPHILAAWRRDPLVEVETFIVNLASRHANVAGDAFVADAAQQALQLGPDDVAVLDPPYSDVQYSRFYHVLETLARGEISRVEGAGRYPPPAERPQSDFSRKARAERALEELLRTLAETGCSAILTFPATTASNGLSGERVTALARSYFSVVSTKVAMRYSTLGGNNDHRPSRHEKDELIVTMRPQ